MIKHFIAPSAVNLTSGFARLARDRRDAKASGQWFQRAAMTMIDEVDRNARTIPAVIATENPVTIWDRGSQRVMQEVLIAGGGQLFEWVPMLDSHQSWSLHSTLGSVLNSRLVKNEVRSTLQFVNSPEVEPVWVRVRDGHLRAVSIGGRRMAWTDIEPGVTAEVAGRRWTAGRVALRITTKWIQREASVVIFGADGGAATDM